MKPTDIALIHTKHVELPDGTGHKADIVRLAGRLFHKPGVCVHDSDVASNHLSEELTACGQTDNGVLVEVRLASKVLAPCSRCWK